LAKEYDRLGMNWAGVDRRAIDNEEVEYEMADAISLPSRFTLRSFVEMGTPVSKLRLLPYGVNVGAFRRSEKRASNFRIAFIGQLCVRKGLHTLLETFSRLNLPGAELVLVGGHTPDTQAILSRYPLDNVTLTGLLPREGVIREMSRASVMVLPSIEEGLALVMAQALACGCPVIASTHTGAEDLFADGEEGFIIDPGDGEGLAERLTRLALDRDLVESMGEKAVRRVQEIGGWDRYGRESLAMFDALLSARSC
jgi:glycosyltransferase involved in cell wall biosynthesis